MTAASMAASLKSGAVFIAWIVTCVPYMALPIPRLVALEVREGTRTAVRHRSDITVMGIIAVIYVTIETMRSMKPGTGSDEYPANKPIRPIITIGSTAIGGIVKIPVRAYRGHSNVDRNLRRCYGHATHQRNSESRDSE